MRNDRVDQDVDGEMRSYRELLEQEKISHGLDPRTAHREALMELGGIEQVKESVRDARAGRLLDSLSSDGRHAWRMILKMPLTAAVVVGSFVVGIGVHAPGFCFIQGSRFES